MKKHRSKEAPSSLGRDGKKSPDIRWKKDGAARMTPAGSGETEPRPEAPLYNPGEPSCSNVPSDQHYVGGSGLPEPEMTSNEYMDMNPTELTAYIAQLVREENLVTQKDLDEALQDDRRRGIRRRSRRRDEIAETYDRRSPEGPTLDDWWRGLMRPQTINTRDWGLLRLHLVERLTIPQIAKRASGMKLRPDAVKKAVYRAQEALRSAGHLPPTS